MKISEIYDYLKLNGVKKLYDAGNYILVESIMIVNEEHAWLNVDFSDDYFSTDPHDAKHTKKLTSSDLDRFISEYKYFYSDDRVRDIKIDKLKSAIMKHRYKEEVKKPRKISSITVNGKEVL